jgi:SPP1 family predicted phage head-tail adaptor
MNIGERRHRVTFQRPTESVNAFGEPAATWGKLCTSWALVQPLKGAERFNAMQVQAEVDHRIVTRSRPELATLGPKDRVLYGSRVFDIKSVIRRDHRDKELEILAREHL